MMVNYETTKLVRQIRIFAMILTGVCNGEYRTISGTAPIGVEEKNREKYMILASFQDIGKALTLIPADT